MRHFASTIEEGLWTFPRCHCCYAAPREGDLSCERLCGRKLPLKTIDAESVRGYSRVDAAHGRAIGAIHMIKTMKITALVNINLGIFIVASRATLHGK